MKFWTALRIGVPVLTYSAILVSPTPMQLDEGSSDGSDFWLGALAVVLVGGAAFAISLVAYLFKYSLKGPPTRSLWDWGGLPLTHQGEAPLWMPVQAAICGIAMPLRTLLRGGEYDPMAVILMTFALGQAAGITLAHRSATRASKHTSSV